MMPTKSEMIEGGKKFWLDAKTAAPISRKLMKNSYKNQQPKICETYHHSMSYQYVEHVVFRWICLLIQF